MCHENLIGFRAFQRLPDNKLCLALEMCELSLYALLQVSPRSKPTPTLGPVHDVVHLVMSRSDASVSLAMGWRTSA